MALEDEILKAQSFLDGAAAIVKQGSNIFDEVTQRLGIISPTQTEVATPPIQPVLQSASTPTPGTLFPNVGLLIVIGVIAYIVLS